MILFLFYMIFLSMSNYPICYVFQTGKIADELDYVGHHIRSKLDELKRQELDRLRDIARKAYGDQSSGPGHVDHQNPHSFEKQDLQKLILQVLLKLLNFYLET